MTVRSWHLVCGVLALSGCTPQGHPRRGPGDEAAIRTVLDIQAAAWNRGDIDGFMAHYWQDPRLTFSSGGTTTRGWQATIDRYHRRYPDRAAMGRLTFDELEIEPMGLRWARVLGRWVLEREEPISGRFTLILQRIDGRWVIVHDHTSISE